MIPRASEPLLTIAKNKILLVHLLHANQQTTQNTCGFDSYSWVKEQEGKISQMPSWDFSPRI